MHRPSGTISTIDGNRQDPLGTTKKIPVAKNSSEPPLIQLNDGDEELGEDPPPPGQDRSPAIPSSRIGEEDPRIDASVSLVVEQQLVQGPPLNHADPQQQQPQLQPQQPQPLQPQQSRGSSLGSRNDGEPSQIQREELPPPRVRCEAVGGSGGGNNPTTPRLGNFTLVSSMREFVLPKDVKGLGQFAASQLLYVEKKLDGFTSADNADRKKTEFRRLTSALARLQPIYDAAAKALEEEESSDEGVELQNALDNLRKGGENAREIIKDYAASPPVDEVDVIAKDKSIHEWAQKSAEVTSNEGL